MAHGLESQVGISSGHAGNMLVCEEARHMMIALYLLGHVSKWFGACVECDENSPSSPGHLMAW